MSARIILENPKSPYNVGGALRACHIFGAKALVWTGERVNDRGDVAVGKQYRLPREERLKEYDNVSWYRMADADLAGGLKREATFADVIPIGVEIHRGAIPLNHYEHPEHATYVFGPEDGNLSRATKEACHALIQIPSATRTPLNLAAAVNVILCHRYIQVILQHR